MPLPRRKPKEFTGRNQPRRELALACKWLNLVELTDFRGKAWRRFYKLETLASAVDKLVRDGDRFITPAFEQELGPGRLTQVAFTLADEDALRLIFHVKVANANRKRASLMLVVAKNAEEASRRIQLEFKHLKILADRLGDDMAVPIRLGTIFMPDRYRRADQNREIAAYITRHPNHCEPLGIHKSGQYMSLGAQPHTFSKRETEQLRHKMTSIIVKAYHPIERDGIDTHQLDLSTFQVQRGSKSGPGLKLFNCVHMQTRLTPVKVLAFLLCDTWKSGGFESPYVPSDPEDFLDALTGVLGKDTALTWLGQYVKLAKTGKAKAPDPEYLDALAALCAPGA